MTSSLLVKDGPKSVHVKISFVLMLAVHIIAVAVISSVFPWFSSCANRWPVFQVAAVGRMAPVLFQLELLLFSVSLSTYTSIICKPRCLTCFYLCFLDLNVPFRMIIPTTCEFFCRPVAVASRPNTVETRIKESRFFLGSLRRFFSTDLAHIDTVC